jgi:L-xylulokinase
LLSFLYAIYSGETVPSLLGIDNGLTVSKAVVFDIDGTQLSVARRRIPQSMPRPRWVERDMLGLWLSTAEAIAEAIAASGRPAADIEAVAATAHGDGVYLVDRERRPLGPGILSLDSRAGEVLARWSREGVFNAALELTGQIPHVSAPSALLAWIKQNDLVRYRNIGSVLACKDWLRLCLTGSVNADPTEASTSFTDFRTQDYSTAALRLYGLEALSDALPPVKGSSQIVGYVTREAASITGLLAGTPVASGLHDVTASALGIGAHEIDVLAIVAGTYSINEVVSKVPRTDKQWFCRNAIEPGHWNNMAISPASTANYDWFLNTLCGAEQEAAAVVGASVHDRIASEVDAALKRRSTVLFHPFLFGSPYGEIASASFFGLHGWHERGDLIKSVLEGIVFNHRTHIDALRAGFQFRSARLTGGGSRNPAFAQLFADALGMPITVTKIDEAAAFGAALCAGAAIGRYVSPGDGARGLVGAGTTYEPNAERNQELDARYAVYARLADALNPLWPDIEALGAAPRDRP